MILKGLYDTEDWSIGCWKLIFANTEINDIIYNILK